MSLPPSGVPEVPGTHPDAYRYSGVALEVSQYNFRHFTQLLYGGRQRTQAFELAIQRRVSEYKGGDCVVMDLGTGPFAVLALAAARAGATKVYAIEANVAAAEQAR